MEKTTVHQNSRSQAVHPPKAVALPDEMKQVDIAATDRTHIITPTAESWDTWFDGNSVTTDFMSAREQPTNQVRQCVPHTTDSTIRD